MELNRLNEIYGKLSRSGWLGAAKTSLLLAEAKAIYERLHPDATPGAVRARGCNIAQGNNVGEKSSSTFSKEVVKENPHRSSAMRSRLHSVSMPGPGGFTARNSSRTSSNRSPSTIAASPKVSPWPTRPRPSRR